MGESSIRGACLCGAVQFELVPPLKFCVHCHCSMCRRSHGAGFVTWTGVSSERLRITAGDDALTRYHSSPGASRRFCTRCGSSLFFEAERWKGEVHVAVANLLDPLPMPPMAHVFYSDRADWIHVADGLPQRGGATGVESMPDSTG